MTVKLVIAGCCGRMGRAIAQAALRDAVFSIGGAFEVAGHQSVNTDYGTVLGHDAPLLPVVGDARRAIAQGDVLVEFTVPEPTVAHAELARELRKPMVIGTTGLSESQIAEIKQAAREVPIVLSPNMSVGVNLLCELAELAARRLGAEYSVTVDEAHHQHKKDAPSGTAKRLAERLAKARGVPVAEIPITYTREGEIVGDHTVLFTGPAERLELTHRAQSREVFALGALKAAQFVVRQPPGLYDMSHVLKAT